MFHHVFRLARPGGGYSYFGEAHRLPAFFYLQFSFMGLVLASCAAIAILVVLLPALHRKMPTLLVGLTAIMTGTVAGYALIIPEWQVGFLSLPSTDALTFMNHHRAPLLKADVSAQPSVDLGLRVGLSGVNFTLVHSARENRTFYWDERIEFDSLDGMASQYKKSLSKGLPLAVLELQEQVVASGEDGFLWPFYLRQAGYYTSWMLAAVLTVWAFSCLLLIMIPKLGSAWLGISGLLMIASCVIYCTLVPAVVGPAGHLRVVGLVMPLCFGPCMWITLVGGVWTTGVGICLYIFHARNPHKFYTDFDYDFDILDQEHKERIDKLAQDEEKARTLSIQDTRL